MTTAYATTADLIEWMPSGLVDGLDAPRVLLRASQRIDENVRVPFGVDDDGVPTDADIAAVLRDATCAQVEFWVETSEEHDIDGLANTTFTVTGFSGRRPDIIGSRALGILTQAGLTGGSAVGVSGQVDWPFQPSEVLG